MSNFKKASQEQAKNFSQVSKTKSLKAPNVLEGYRGGLLVSNVLADVMKRDSGNDQYEIDVIFYCEPNTDVRKAFEVCQKSCIDVFGHNPPDGVSLFFHDGRIPVMGNQRIAYDLEVNGRREKLVCVSFGVKIHYPHSVFYNMATLKNQFAERITYHMMETK
jgi:hypothetical protein